MARTLGALSGRTVLLYAKDVARLSISGIITVMMLGETIKSNNRYYVRENENAIEEELYNCDWPHTDVNDLYSEFFQNKLAATRSEIREIEFDLKTRQSIHKELITEIDHQVLSASLFLNQLKHWAIGYRVGVDLERNLWERKIADLLKEKRMEKLRIWRESSSLKERKRELLREYEELFRRQLLLR